MEEKYFFLYFNATIATLMVNLLVYSDLRVAITPVLLPPNTTYCHALVSSALKQNNSAHVHGHSYPRTRVSIPTYTGTDAQSLG